MKNTPKLALLAAALILGSSANAATTTPKPNTISFTTFPSDTPFKTNALSVIATASAGTPTITVTGPATYSAATKTITLNGVGTVQVVASEATAPSGYALPTPVTNSFTVSQASQTIPEFSTIAPTNWSTSAPVITVPLPVATSKLPVTLSVVSGPGSVTSSNKITASGAGSILIAANQAGNANYTAASQVTTTITIAKGSNSLTAFGATTPASVTYTNGGTFTIAVPKGRASTPVTVTATGANVSSDGTTATITPTGAGSVVLTANQSGDDNWNSATAVTKTVTVAKGVAKITADQNYTPTYSTNIAPITVTPTSPSQGAFTYSSVATPTTAGNVNATTGLVTITGAGTIVVKATQAADTNYAAVTTAVTVSTITVGKGVQNISPFVSISDQAFSTNSISITPPTSDAGAVVTVSVLSGPATYNATSKKLTLTGTGQVTLAANAAATANYNAATQVTTSFMVGQASQNIANFAVIPSATWSTNAPVITIPIPAATSKLPVTLSVLSGPGNLTSSNKITATGAGSIVIAANQDGNSNYSAAAQVTTTITVSQGSNSLTAFGTTAPTSVNYGTNGGVFTIAVPKGKASTPVTVTATGATVSSDGTTATVTPTGAGSVVLTANQSGDDNWNSATAVTKTVTVAKGSAVITPDDNQTTTFSPTVGTLNVNPTSTSTGAFTYSSTATPTTAGKVDANTGVVTITGAGTIVVKATQAADSNYAAVTTAVTVCTITVAKGTQTLNTPPNVPIPASGTSVTVPSGKSDQGVTLTYSISGPAGFVASTGKLTPTGNGTIGVNATTGTNANYNPLASTPVVTFTATKVGTTSTYNFSKQ
jgi:hypothetical protein